MFVCHDTVPTSNECYYPPRKNPSQTAVVNPPPPDPQPQAPDRAQALDPAQNPNVAPHHPAQTHHPGERRPAPRPQRTEEAPAEPLDGHYVPEQHQQPPPRRPPAPNPPSPKSSGTGSGTEAGRSTYRACRPDSVDYTDAVSRPAATSQQLVLYKHFNKGNRGFLSLAMVYSSFVAPFPFQNINFSALPVTVLQLAAHGLARVRPARHDELIKERGHICLVLFFQPAAPGPG